MLIFIWIIISLFLLGISGWTVVILRQQKRSWSAFAARHGLEYQKGGFMESPIVRGTLGGFSISLFCDAQQTDDVRGRRYVSVIEIETGSGMPTGAAMGTQEMRAFIETLAFPDIVAFEHEKWLATYVVKTRDAPALKAFMTKERMDALTDVMRMTNVAVLFFFDELAGILHLETVDPLRDPERLDRIMKRLIAAITILVPEVKVASPVQPVIEEQITPPAPPPDQPSLDTEQ